MSDVCRGQSILVTGAAGFIGSHVAASLVRTGHRVVGVDNFDPFYARPLKLANVAAIGEGFTLHEHDICDAEAMHDIFERVRPAAVIHLAALAGVRPSIARPEHYARVNVLGTLNVLEAARLAGVGTMVFGSSSSVYGNASAVPFREDDAAIEPISPYAATKRAGELLCHAHAHVHGMRIGCVRFFTVYGPRQRPDLAIAKFMQLMREGRPIPMFGDGATSRDYTYIDDIVEGVRSALRVVSEAPAGDPGGFLRTWNIGGAHPVTLRELISAIEQVSGLKARLERLPKQPGDVERTYADLTRSREELNYRPRTSLLDGLASQWEAMIACGATRLAASSAGV